MDGKNTLRHLGTFLGKRISKDLINATRVTKCVEVVVVAVGGEEIGVLNTRNVRY